MTYYNREPQLLNTLESIKNTEYKDFFIVIVDDGSRDDINLPELPYPIEVIKIRKDVLKWTNSDVAFNRGFIRAIDRGADIIIFQNAECFHVGDVISYALNVTDNTYISFGCYSQGKEDNLHNMVYNNIGASFDGQSAWYNHPTYRAVGYHFCCAITANNLKKLNGFDERFSEGVCYDDNYLIDRVRLLGLNINITTNPFVIHQWHYSSGSTDGRTAELAEKNRLLYERLKSNLDYRAVHLITSEL